MKNHKLISKNNLLIASVAVSLSLLSACGGGKQSTSTNPAVSNTPVLELNLPNSVTGGTQAAAMVIQQQAQAQVSGNVTDARMLSNVVSNSTVAVNQPCHYIGVSDNDPFRNGHQMTKFMVSVIATWTCVADTLITLSNFIAHDGAIIATENDTTASNYDPEEPTHYSVSDDSATQTTIRIYYRYTRATPPRIGDDPQFFISWNKTASDSNPNIVEGRLVIDGVKIQANSRKADDPTKLRMDFNYTQKSKNIDMFLQFDSGNQWADGFRITVSKDLTANLLNQVYVASGLIKMKRQFLPVAGITEIPNVRMFAVSNSFGSGAAIAELQNVSLPIELNAATNNHLGNYLFTKTDKYYFKADQRWDWVQKSITSSEYRGARTTPATGGVAGDPSLESIKTQLGLNANYFTGTLCANLGDSCNELLNSVYRDGFFSHEKNQGSDPMDWRSTALATPNYLTSVYPNGADWFGAFAYSFTPSL